MKHKLMKSVIIMPVQHNVSKPLKRNSFYHYCLAQLKPKLKEVLLFIYNQAIPLKEVAHLLDCPENTIKARAFQARKKLQQCIQEVCQ